MRRLVLATLLGLVSERPAPSFEAEAHAASRPLDELRGPVQPFIHLGQIAGEVAGDLGTDAQLREATVPRKVHLPQKAVTPAIAQLAERFLDRPMGSETFRTVDGARYSFCVEPHFHAPGSGFLPEGWHKGVTVYRFED